MALRRKTARRRRRSNKCTCTCSAYKFPHRFLGGKCRGVWVAEQAWELSYGRTGICGGCNNVNSDSSYNYCEVLEGQERLINCPAWQEFLADHDIKVPRRMKPR